MTTPAIDINGLEKIYRSSRREGSVHALKPLRLEIARGEVFGLLGPNGAGKTTLVKLLLGITHPSSGSASVVGRPIGSTDSKKTVGYLPENHRYPSYLTGAGVLSYFGKLSGLGGADLNKRIAELLELVNMTKWADVRVKKYSKGMMQRVGLAQSLLNDPEVIFLDEPTDGVDPLGRKEIRDLILQLRARGKTIFLNSHLLSEIELISDRVAILNKGELVRIGTVKELTENAHLYRIEVAEEQHGRLTSVLAQFKPREIEGGATMIEVPDTSGLNAAIDRLRAEGLLITAITPTRQTLEEYFIDIVGKEGTTR